MNSKKINIFREKLIKEVEDSMDKLNELENNRQYLIQDNCLQIYNAEELFYNKLVESNSNITSQMKSFDSEKEINSIFIKIEQLDNIINTEVNDIKFVELNPKIEKIIDILDYFKSLVTRILQMSIDHSELEKLYAKSIQRSIEKNGLTYLISNSKSVSNNNLQYPTFADYLNNYESSTLKESVESISILYLVKSNSHIQNIDKSTNNFHVTMSSIQKQLDLTRKNLFDKLSLNNKRIELSYSNISKLETKLMKLQSYLLERRETANKIREDISEIEALKEKEKDINNNSTSISNKVISSDSNEIATPSSATSPPTSSNNTVASKNFLNHGFGKVIQGKRMSINGLETPNDRLARIELKNIGLEKDEIDLIENMSNLKEALESSNDISYNEMLHLFNSSKDLIRTDVIDINECLNLFLIQQLQTLEILKNSLDEYQLKFKSIDLKLDKSNFINYINEQSKKNITDINNDGVYDFSSVTEFGFISNDIIIEERKYQEEQNISQFSSPVQKVNESPIQINNEMDKDSIEEINNSLINDIKSELLDDGNNDDDNIDEENYLSDVVNQDYDKTKLESNVNNIIKEEIEDEIVTDVSINDHDKDDDDITEQVDESSNKLELSSVIAERNSEDSIENDSNNNEESNSSEISPSKSNVSSPASKVPTNSVSSTDNKKDEDKCELSKFGLSFADKILESFSCALYPKKGILQHGRIFVTQHYIAFSSWLEMRVLIAMHKIKEIKKMNTITFIPNAIEIFVEGESFFFGSFIERDQCYSLIYNMSEISKRISELHGNNESRTLTLGYQTPISTGILSTVTSAAKGIVDDAQSITSSFTKHHLLKGYNDKINKGELDASKVPSKEISSQIGECVDDDSNNNNEDDDDEEEEIVDGKFIDDSINLSQLYSQKNITLLEEHTSPIGIDEIWRTCWLNGSGYTEFLESEGDLELEIEEWSAISPNSPQPEGDISKLTFTHSRLLTYAHPRTSMLMFGPKNASVTQWQYLYIAGSGVGNSVTVDNPELPIDKVKPKRYVIFTVSTFEGIPMADVFKVCQYWSFDKNINKTTQIRAGLYIHFVKTCFVKSQVFSGVREELFILVGRFFQFVKSKSKNKNISNNFIDNKKDNKSLVFTNNEIKKSESNINTNSTNSNKNYIYVTVAMVVVAIFITYCYSSSGSTSASDKLLIKQLTEKLTNQEKIILKILDHLKLNIDDLN
jgi:hypothetical protein